jgi:hypothetical protein
VADAHDRLQERLDETAALRLVLAEREDLLELVHDQRQASVGGASRRTRWTATRSAHGSSRRSRASETPPDPRAPGS